MLFLLLSINYVVGKEKPFLLAKHNVNGCEMKRKIVLVVFSVTLVSSFLLTSLLIRSAYCRLQNPTVNVDPSKAFVGQEVSVESTVDVVGG